MKLNEEQRLRVMEMSATLYASTHQKVPDYNYSEGRGRRVTEVIGDIFDDLSAKIEGRTIDRPKPEKKT